MKKLALALLLSVPYPAFACTVAGDACADGSTLIKVDAAAKVRTFMSATATRQTYASAAATCDAESSHGRSDWRLPDRYEAQLVATYGKQSYYVWSSTMGGSTGSQVWASRWFNNALVENLQGQSSFNYTRCVRTEPIPDEPPPGGGDPDPGTDPGDGSQAGCVAINVQAAQLGPETFAANFTFGFGAVLVPFLLSFFFGRTVIEAIRKIGG